MTKANSFKIWDIMIRALKKRIGIYLYNEEMFCLSSLSMPILSLSAILIKDVPDLKS